MVLPNYNDGSIVNLMSSISKALGSKSKYKPLKSLDSKGLTNSKNIVLIIIDGLGYEWLLKYGRESTFNKNIKNKITSIFPSTTATCVTTFATGLAPQQHAITGWFMHLKELGVVSAILPFIPRSGGLPFSQTKIDPRKIFNQKSITEKIKVKSYLVTNKEIIKSDYTIATSKNAKRIHYNSLTGFFKAIKQPIFLNNKRKFIYAYWPDFDTLCHKHGTKSKKVISHFKKLDKKLNSFLKSINKTNTTVIITADHGLINGEDSKIIELKKHPKLAETLILPLCGEPRVAYCYVRPSKVKQFEKYIKENFKDKCYMYKSEKLIKKNYFGLFKPNKDLFDRIGDYTLIMKENYIIKDLILGEEKHKHIGHHGGISKEEMFVPLIIINK